MKEEEEIFKIPLPPFLIKIGHKASAVAPHGLLSAMIDSVYYVLNKMIVKKGICGTIVVVQVVLIINKRDFTVEVLLKC